VDNREDRFGRGSFHPLGREFFRKVLCSNCIWGKFLFKPEERDILESDELYKGNSGIILDIISQFELQ
jgi:hypothetical protein